MVGQILNIADQGLVEGVVERAEARDGVFADAQAQDDSLVPCRHSCWDTAYAARKTYARPRERLAEPREHHEVGRTFNVTRERIRQIENQSLKKLRALAEIDHLRDIA